MIRGAIFDADGTLLDSMGLWDTVGERYLRSLGIDPAPGLRQILFPMSLSQCAAYLRERYALTPSCQAIEDGINQTILTFYQNQVRAKAGAVDFLQSLRRQGVATYLATATDRTVITQGLARTGWQAGYRVAGVADPYSDQAALRATCHIYLPDLTDFPGFYAQARQA